MKNKLYFIVFFFFCLSIFMPRMSDAFMGQVAKPVVTQTEKQLGKALTSLSKPKTLRHTIGGNSQILAKNLGRVPSGYQAHHIIPVECRTHPVLNKIGFDMDDAVNGIALPSRPGLDPKLPVHRGYHSDYSQAVRRELDAIPQNLSQEETRRRVMGVISKFRTEIENGRSLYRIEGAPNAWK